MAGRDNQINIADEQTSTGKQIDEQRQDSRSQRTEVDFSLKEIVSSACLVESDLSR